MEPGSELTPTETHAASTQQKRTTTGVDPPPTKRPPIRSNHKSATDFLLDEYRIGRATQYPSKKRRYVQLNMLKMMTSLVTLYTFLFTVRWNHFRHLEPRGNNTGRAGFCKTMATTYLSHWLVDCYRMIRSSLEHLDPAAFREKYYEQFGTESNIYDNFLSTLCSHIRPTHIVNSVSDCIYIPLFTKYNANNVLIFEWTEFTRDRDLFSSLIEIMSEKKVVKMTPLSADLLGRPSWLFDWTSDGTAFAWFPQEGNYSDDDVTVAYIIGDACSPKLSLADVDEWKYTTTYPTLDNAYEINRYSRVAPRRWYGNSEYRFAEIESVHHPNFKESDPAKLANDNFGPLQDYAQITSSARKEKGTSSNTATTEEVVSEVDLNTVPPSPTRHTRSSGTKFYRARVTDRMYYAQVVFVTDDASRYAAFKMFNKPE